MSWLRLSRGVAWLGRSLLRLSGEEEMVRLPALAAALAKRETRYAVFRALRKNNAVFDRIRHYLNQRKESLPEGYRKLLALRNPANRVVEFYASKLAGEDLLEILEPGEKAIEKLAELVGEVWRWSNLRARLKPMARMFATDGEIYLHQHNEDDRVHIERLEPETVTDQELDGRGHLTYLRLDVLRQRRNADGKVEEYVHTEVWDKLPETPRPYHRVWEHEKEPGEDLDKLGTPAVDEDLSETQVDASRPFTGHDFVPVVYRRFRDTDDAFGENAFEPAIDLIEHVSKTATKLAAMLFPETVWAVIREGGPSAEDLPPVKVEVEEPPTRDEAASQEKGGEDYGGYVKVAGQRMFRLPPGANTKPLIPPIDFESHQAALAEDMREIEALLPELTLDRIRESGDRPSGKAMDRLLEDLRDRVKEARGNFEDALVRAMMMALTLGKIGGAKGFEVVPEGAYGEGQLEFRFAERDAFPASEAEKMQAEKSRADVYAAYAKIGADFLRWKLEEEGVPQEVIDKIVAESEAVRRARRMDSWDDDDDGNEGDE